MANLYLKLIEDARKLPAAYQAMGTPAQIHTSESPHRAPITVRGWRVCQIIYKMNEDGREWWSNDINVFVDESGQLWQLTLSEEFSPHQGGGHKSSVGLGQIDGERLRQLHSSSTGIDKIQKAIEGML